MKGSKRAKIRNRYNQVPHLTQDINEKVTNSKLYTTNESQEVSRWSKGKNKQTRTKAQQTQDKKHIKDPQKLYCISQLRWSLWILQGAFLQLRHSDNNGYKSLTQDAPLWWQIKFEKPIRRRKVKPLHAVLRQETSYTRQKDKELKAAYFIC